jgi:hypothetical protein
MIWGRICGFPPFNSYIRGRDTTKACPKRLTTQPSTPSSSAAPPGAPLAAVESPEPRQKSIDGLEPTHPPSGVDPADRMATQRTGGHQRGPRSEEGGLGTRRAVADCSNCEEYRWLSPLDYRAELGPGGHPAGTLWLCDDCFDGGREDLVRCGKLPLVDIRVQPPTTVANWESFST